MHPSVFIQTPEFALEDLHNDCIIDSAMAGEGAQCA
jgi:hypothetical protein